MLDFLEVSISVRNSRGIQLEKLLKTVTNYTCYQA
jgi:hypothetical protein